METLWWQNVETWETNLWQIKIEFTLHEHDTGKCSGGTYHSLIGCGLIPGSHRICSPTPVLCWVVTVLACYVVECEAENLYQSGAQVKNVRSCAFMASCIFMAWCQLSKGKIYHCHFLHYIVISATLKGLHNGEINSLGKRSIV